MADEALQIIADYVHDTPIDSQEAFDTARLCLADALGCALLALNHDACTKLLGPVVPGTVVPKGSRVPGTPYILDPIKAAFDLGTMIRWLDFNDTFLAEEWGHPSDNLGGILALADYLAQRGKPLIMRDVLTALIKAYEIQGVLSLRNSYNRIGLDHVIFVKVATSAISAHLLGANPHQIIEAVSHAWIDSAPLRTYRHEPSTGSRKSWAAGDATSRGVQFALMTQKGEMGYPEALSSAKWGVYDVLFKGNPLIIDRTLGSYVIENILFKVAFPAEFHAQTAVEAALTLHPEVKHRLEDISFIEIETQAPAARIIDKKGPLTNPADRDHCLQYMVAMALIHGELKANHYEDEHAAHPHLEPLRKKMRVKEHPPFSKGYLDPKTRSIANRLTIHFKDGTTLGPLSVEFPLGHRKRRQEAYPHLMEKLEHNLGTRLPQKQVDHLLDLFQDQERLEAMPVNALISLLTSSAHS